MSSKSAVLCISKLNYTLNSQGICSRFDWLIIQTAKSSQCNNFFFGFTNSIVELLQAICKHVANFVSILKYVAKITIGLYFSVLSDKCASNYGYEVSSSFADFFVLHTFNV